MASVTMNNRQEVDASFDIKDEDGQIFAELPAGATVTYVSDRPDVADFEEDSTSLKGIVTSGVNGVAKILGTATMADGKAFTDTLEVTVTGSAPNSATFTVGTPTDQRPS